MTGLADLGPWARVLLAFTLLLALVGLLRVYQRRARPEPELVRKLFHLGGGVLCLWIPWVFQDLAPVLALGAATIGLFAALRAVPALRDGPGQVLAGVKRPTVGEFCFVTSFCLLFWLSAGDRLLYGVPLLVLAVADSFAALVGTAYGRYHFRAWRGRKSVEGSVAFFLAAFLCVHVPVLLFTETGRTESLLIALNLALMVMMAEAAAWWGLDNLIIPLFSYVLLRSFLPMDATELIQHLAFLVGLSLFVRFWRQRTTLADDALFGVSLWGYVVWAMADWRWVVPPFLVILTYSVITRRTPHDHVGAFNFPVALANIVAGLLWLLLYHASGDGRYFYPFAAAFAANLAMIALVRHASWRPDSPMPEALGFSVVRGVLLLVPAILLVDGLTPAAVRNVISGAVAVALAAATFRAVQPAIDRFPVDTARWLRQAAVSIAASSLTLVPHLGPG